MLTVAEILEAAGGELLQNGPCRPLRGVATDTRKVRAREVFIAIKGDNFDGHDFLQAAVDAGAAALVIGRKPRELPSNVPVIWVKDTIEALGAVARYHRLKFNIPVVAVTGSAGKTTTKEYIAAVLGRKFRVLFNKGTENNQIGVPMTLLRLNRRHQAAVIEAGTNHSGEIDRLGRIIVPSMAVFTNIGESHLAGLKDPEGVYQEKAALLRHLTAGGLVVVNRDDSRLRQILKKKVRGCVVSYGIEPGADLCPVAVTARGRGLEVDLGRAGRFCLSAPVWGNVYNALAAAACGRWLKVPCRDIVSALGSVKPVKGRHCFHAVHGVTVIDDTYNANPVSYHNAIRTLTLMRRPTGRLCLVAADMLELGDKSEALHAGIGRAAAKAGIDIVLTVGQCAREIGKGALKVNPSMTVKAYHRQEDILPDLAILLKKGDTVLVKGSRGMCMDRLVEDFVSRSKKSVKK
jgi:UDP-N-acetylmuramoyl-tripeptide--D-alanyl-D-alanine ligase